MNRLNANKLWGMFYFNIAPLCFKMVEKDGDYSVIFTPSGEEVRTFDEGLTMLKKRNISIGKENGKK